LNNGLIAHWRDLLPSNLLITTGITAQPTEFETYNLKIQIAQTLSSLTTILLVLPSDLQIGHTDEEVTRTRERRDS
jgi:hypothetical protein